jgi:hypothetical protein
MIGMRFGVVTIIVSMSLREDHCLFTNRNKKVVPKIQKVLWKIEVILFQKIIG